MTGEHDINPFKKYDIITRDEILAQGIAARLGIEPSEEDGVYRFFGVPGYEVPDVAVHNRNRVDIVKTCERGCGG